MRLGGRCLLNLRVASVFVIFVESAREEPRLSDYSGSDTCLLRDEVILRA